MPVREGGSYAADPGTGEETLVERTKQPELHRTVEQGEAPEVPTAPAAPAPEEPPTPPASRRRGDNKTKE